MKMSFIIKTIQLSQTTKKNEKKEQNYVYLNPIKVVLRHSIENSRYREKSAPV